MRLLLVEDDPVLADGLGRALRAAGYSVDCTHDGLQADRILQQPEFALVVLDLGLPGMDGVEVLQRLRRRGARLPVLLLTARDTVEDRVLGLDAGADDYLRKPFAMSELLARVRALLRRSRPAAAEKVRYGNFTMDVAGKRAWVDDTPLDLSAREWSVLEYLLAKAGRVVSKDQIIEAIASWDEELTPNAVEVYVSRVRAKLEASGVKIRTVRGFGYIVEAPDGRT
jgi:two-component system OmpR family response regulator